jgi:hypothetical protein
MIIYIRASGVLALEVGLVKAIFPSTLVLIVGKASIYILFICKGGKKGSIIIWTITALRLSHRKAGGTWKMNSSRILNLRASDVQYDTYQDDSKELFSSTSTQQLSV